MAERKLPTADEADAILRAASERRQQAEADPAKAKWRAERIAALRARFDGHSATRGSPSQPNGDGDFRAALERFRQWCLDRSEYGEEIILRRCGTCGAEEYLDEASGRIKLDHHYGPHNPITMPAQEGEALPVRRSFGERDDDDDAIFGTTRRAAGY